jgi:hypothetical protein
MTDLADAVDELLVLWPALATALQIDGGTSSGERVTTSENIHTVPLNVEVAGVIHDLDRAIPDWTRWAATAAGLGHTSAGIEACLRRIVGIHDRLTALGRTRDTERLTAEVERWRQACRRALGLNRPDESFGENCPYHDDQLTQLVRPGEVGHLRYAKLDRAGYPVGAYIVWTRLDVVCCRHCDAVWTPGRYMFLAKLVRQADRDRAARAEETSDAA